MKRSLLPRFDSGAILLEILAILIIIFTLAGITMSFNAMEVDAGKNIRVKEDMNQITTAVESYAKDFIRQRCKDGSGQVNYPDKYLFPNTLADLLAMPESVPALQYFWKGPYLDCTNSNVSNQQSLIVDSNNNMIDPWGRPYEPSFTGLTFSLMSKGPSESDSSDDITKTIDMSGFALKESNARMEIINAVLTGLLSGSDNCIWGTQTDWVSQFNSLAVTNHYIPYDWRYASDAWGNYFLVDTYVTKQCVQGAVTTWKTQVTKIKLAPH